VIARPDDSAAPLVVVNPRAARLHDAARRAALVERVVRAVRERTGSTPWVEDGSLENAQFALERSADRPLVVVAGGDGTVRQAAAALTGRGIPLAIVPGGTGNVLAAALGVRGIAPAIEVIRAGRPRTIDLGVATWGVAGDEAPTGRGAFLVACGMGLDARIMAAAEHAWKRRLRFGAYVGAAIRELHRLQSVDFRLTVDGAPLEMRGYLVLVANAGEIVPGRIGPRQPIDPSDGLLDLLVLGGSDPLAGLRGAGELLLRTGELRGAVVRRPVSTVRIEADPPQPLETDGDAHPPGWIEARVVPAAIPILVPRR
jgi:diacylglycerol kinase family enzyme